MFFRRKSNRGPASGSAAAPAAEPKDQPQAPVSSLATEKVVLPAAYDGPKPLGRHFPGPRQAEAALRVHFERKPYAELLAHAKESLEVEVCGVLVGQMCQDEEGLFVEVNAVIRGTAATEGSTHVTFTQTTWNAIHRTLEHDFPKLRIVGWYHTHPGFGVQFSDMDLFIQKNFFSGPTQVALVTDPLSGAVALCINTPAGARYLPRYWVDGREQPARVPAPPAGATQATPGAAEASGSTPSLEQLEARVSQLVQALDEQRASFHYFLLFCGVVFCLAVIGTAGYFMYSTYTSKLEPPRLNSFAPVPVQIGDKTVLLGVGVVEWKVPDELNSLMLQVELLKRLAAEKAAKEAAAKGDTNAPALAPAGTNAPATATRPVGTH